MEEFLRRCVLPLAFQYVAVYAVTGAGREPIALSDHGRLKLIYV